jgi:hypothetical protein
MFHKNIIHNSDNIHTPFNWVVADEAARLALAVSAADVYKACWQIDEAAVYILTSVTPTWEAISGGGGGAVEGPAFSVTKSATQLLAQNTTSNIIFDVEQYDTHNGFASNVFIVPTGWAGLYQFTLRIGSTAGSGSNQVSPSIALNGAGYGGTNTIANNAGWLAQVDLVCAEGDELKATVFLGAGTAVTLRSGLQCLFQGHYVRSTP